MPEHFLPPTVTRPINKGLFKVVSKAVEKGKMLESAQNAPSRPSPQRTAPKQAGPIRTTLGAAKSLLPAKNALEAAQRQLDAEAALDEMGDASIVFVAPSPAKRSTAPDASIAAFRKLAGRL